MTDGNSKKPDDAGPDDADAENPAFVWTPYEGAEDSLMPEDPESLSYRDGLQQGSADEAREEERRAKDRDDKNVFALGGALSQEKMLKMQNLAEAGNFKIAGFGGYGADKKALEEKQRMNDYFRRMVGGYMTPQQWDSQMTSFGGLQMTNAESQRRRKWALANFEDVFNTGVTKGKFKEDDKEELRELLRRQVELNEKQRLNTITEEESRELKKIEQDERIQEINKLTNDSNPQFKEGNPASQMNREGVSQTSTAGLLARKAGGVVSDSDFSLSATFEDLQYVDDVGFPESTGQPERKISTPVPSSGIGKV